MAFNKEHHRNVLVNILKDIFSDHHIAPFIAFKGGTAAMLFYQLPRFSVDLDFDLLDPDQEEVIFERIKEILKKYGTVKKADNKRYTLFFLLAYEGKLDGAYNIKVEVNKRNFGARYHIMSFLGIPMKVMIQEDMIAHKLLALYHRMGTANRDIFDVWYFLKNNWSVSKKSIESREGIEYKTFLERCIATLEKYDDRQILTGLGDLLTPEQRRWVQASLKNDTLFFLRLALKNEEDFFKNSTSSKETI